MSRIEPHASNDGQPDALARREQAWRWLPWGVSIALHAGLVISGFFIVWSVAAPAAEIRPPVVVSFDEPSPVRLTADDPPQLSGEGAPAASVSARPVETQRSSLSELVAGLDASRAAPSGATPSGTIDRAKLAGERRFPEVRFAGMGAGNAESIVYVVDASGSMVSTFPFVLARLESSVSKLASTQRFQIIFFQRDDAVTAPHPEDDQTLKPKRLIRASKDNVARVLAWAKGVKPAGKGNPIRALQTALALKPDAIFILSSATTSAAARGLDRDTVLADLEKLNPARPGPRPRATVIKTIQFIDPDPAEILKAIGEVHGGSDGYRFIPREELSHTMTRHALRILIVFVGVIAMFAAPRAARGAEPEPAAPHQSAPTTREPAHMSVAEIFFIQRHPTTKEIEWFGSMIIWSLLVLSASSLALMGVLLRDNRRDTFMPEGLAPRLRDVLREKRIAFASDVAAQSGAFLGVVMHAALAESAAGYNAMMRAAESAADELTLRRMRRAEPLAVIGNVAPMVGLFGTVYGIILAFRAIVAAGGSPDPVSLAAGIGTALVSTFWGLVVAIPALSVYAVIRGRIDGMTLEASRTAEELLGVVRGLSSKPLADKSHPRHAESPVGVSA